MAELPLDTRLLYSVSSKHTRHSYASVHFHELCLLPGTTFILEGSLPGSLPSPSSLLLALQNCYALIWLPQPLLPPCSGPKSQRTGVLTAPATTHVRSTAACALPDENRPLLMPVPHSYRLTDTRRNMHLPHRPAPSNCWLFSHQEEPCLSGPAPLEPSQQVLPGQKTPRGAHS